MQVDNSDLTTSSKRVNDQQSARQLNLESVALATDYRRTSQQSLPERLSQMDCNCGCIAEFQASSPTRNVME